MPSTWAIQLKLTVNTMLQTNSIYQNSRRHNLEIKINFRQSHIYFYKITITSTSMSTRKLHNSNICPTKLNHIPTRADPSNRRLHETKFGISYQTRILCYPISSVALANRPTCVSSVYILLDALLTAMLSNTILLCFSFY
jgi:hypothetical protein